MRESWSKEKLVEQGGAGKEEDESVPLEPVQLNQALSPEEKKFLLLAERGDVASVRRILDDHQERSEILDVNCVDPLNRSALIAAIENENIELIRLLLEYKIKVKDSLLHAIKEEYVEAVELLLEYEERTHVKGQPYSWEAVDRDSSNFTPDITPLILAAHMNNYEILKILLDRGASVPIPHDIRCGCDECVVSREHDSLRHSQSRINAYRALSSPSLIALSSNDPVVTAFHLSWELRRMSRMETEFRDDYNELRAQCQTFATSLLDHVRTSFELETMLNYDPEASHFETWQPGERQTLQRLKLAIKYKQKKFVAHPNVQQLLAAIWYEGLPGFRRKGPVQQILEVAKLGCMFPMYTAIYMLAPKSKWGIFMTKPFVKFICHSASYGLFLMLLGAASQRIETLFMEWFGNEWMRELVGEWKRKERGSLPGLVESVIFIYIISLIWNEARALWSDGILDYISDLWNIVDFITNMFYCCWIFMRISAWYIVQRESYYGLDPYYPRENWDMLDPMLISEGAFAAGMIFSFLKLVHIFSVNPHLGPLQISLGRMIIDIMKFFFIYTLVLFAFGCGLNQLMWYYAELEKVKCYDHGDIADFMQNEMACTIWRRFSNLFETSQTLFWAGFGLVDLVNFELTGIKGFTRFWGLLVFGSYSVINIIVLLNMLIAMMSNSYQIISERSDMEWKFARSKLWMSYFDDSDTIPPPFNLLPSMNLMSSFFRSCDSSLKATASMIERTRIKSKVRHENVMKLLVRRYVMAEQRKRDEVGITEDDIMEVRQDISTLRFELIDILANNGMKTPKIDANDSNVPGKKGRVMERRLLKDFQIGLVEGTVMEAIQADKSSTDVFSKIARAIGKRASSKKNKDWNAIVRKGTIARNPIGSTSEAQARRETRQSIRKYIIENQNQIGTLDPEKLVQYNPKLSSVSPATRVAYAKFKINKIKTEYEKRQVCASETSSVCESSMDLQKAASIDENRIQDTTVVEISREDNGEYEEPAASVKDSDVPDPEPAVPMQGGFRPKTPIMEDPREDLQTPSLDEHGPGSPRKLADTEPASPPRMSLSPSHMPSKRSTPDVERKQLTPTKFSGNWL